MNKWYNILKDEMEKDYYKKLMTFLNNEYKTKTVYPSKDNIFKALSLTTPNNIKIVILGQDPYHNKKQANGLAFSVNNGVPLPKSLLNIYKEISNSLNISMSGTNGDLKSWSKQGVLLLNTVLTVVENKPNSHKNIGWQIFTDKVIEIVNTQNSPCVFMLWGNNAKSKRHLITNKNHLILESVHPSPLSAYRGFFNCNHFKYANEFLMSNNLSPINFKI